MQERKMHLDQHPYKIFFDAKKGYYVTHVLNENKKRKQVKCKTLKGLEDKLVEYYKKQTENPTLEEVFNRWNDKRLDLQQISGATHLANVNLFNRHFDEIRMMRIKNITPLFLEDYLQQQIPKHNMKKKAFRGLKSLVRDIFERARKENLVSFDIEDVLKGIKLSDHAFNQEAKKDCDDVYSEEETEILMKYFHQNLDIHNLGLMLLFVTGLRSGELVSLRPKDLLEQKIRVYKTETSYLDRNTGKKVVAVKETTKTKAGNREVLVVSEYKWLLKRLKQQNPFGEYVFMYNGNRMKAEAFRDRMQRVCKKLGIKYKALHAIRKTYATMLLNNDVDTRFIIQQLGHTDILCTEKFYHRNRKSDEQKNEQLAQIPEFKSWAL